MVEVMRIRATSFRRVVHALPHSGPLALLQATTDPHLHRRCCDTHSQVWVSLLWDHCPFLLGPGVLNVFFVPSKESVSQSCVSYGHSVVGLMVTSSKRCPSKQDPVPPPPVSLSHQEASISPLSLSIRGQTE